MVQEELTITAAKGGDVTAFNELVLRYQDHVYSAAYRILQDKSAADDITQDTFITAFRKLHQYQTGNFRAWLQRIAINACYDELRKQKRHPTDSIDDDNNPLESDGRLVSKTPLPEAQLQQSELSDAIVDCFEQLKANYRLVAVMADIEQYSYEDIATLANISLGTVKSRISRARGRLRDCLQAKGELLPRQYRSPNEGQE